MVSGLGQRRVLVCASLATYVVVVFAIPTGPLWGSAAGAIATGVCLVGAGINPEFDATQKLLSVTGGIRFVSCVGIGWLVGSSAARKRELMRRLREHAERAFLTDLLNTPAFEEALGDRISRAEPFALLLADVDDLKLVNDTDGHAAGNDYLRRMAGVLREETSPEDTVARIGGDEFAVLTGTVDAEAACVGLQDALARRGISASFGYAISPVEGNDRLALFHIADKRLYEGKLSGTGRRLRSVS